MSDAHDAPCTPEPISQELDDLTCSLIDYALDILATSGELSVSLAVAAVVASTILTRSILTCRKLKGHTWPSTSRLPLLNVRWV